jgi:hypothetical protein
MNDEFNHENENGQSTFDKVKEWTQENIRIIVSILIVFLIATSIYSYSKRGEENVEIAEKNNDIEAILEDLSSMDTEENADISDSAATDEAAEKDTAKENEEVAVNTEKNPTAEKEETTPSATEKEAMPTKTESVAKPATEKIAAQETENSFIESAQRGDGVTHLARRALAHYLEKNTDSSLSAEHKIYIEDYLRKKVGFQERVYVGTSVEFSKNLIQEAIGASKNLNESQLKNLQKYSQNVNF